jgi:predicted phage tail protein
MTTVIFHGLLAKKFGSHVKLHLGNLNFLFVAIDAVKVGFLNFIKEKQKENQFYSFCTKREIKEIHIFPSLIGAGRNFGIILGFLMFGAIGGAIIWATGLYKSPLFWKIIGIMFQVAGMILNIFVPGAGFVLQAIGTAIQAYGSVLEAEQKAEKYNNITRRLSAGGGSAAIEIKGRSYVFDSFANLSKQGNLVTLGYGKVKVGSLLISTNVRNFETNSFFEKETSFTNENYIYG